MPAAELQTAGAHAESAMARAKEPHIKTKLRTNTEKAQAAGISAHRALQPAPAGFLGRRQARSNPCVDLALKQLLRLQPNRTALV
jgi:hypothetical protein